MCFETCVRVNVQKPLQKKTLTCNFDKDHLLLSYQNCVLKPVFKVNGQKCKYSKVNNKSVDDFIFTTLFQYQVFIMANQVTEVQLTPRFKFLQWLKTGLEICVQAVWRKKICLQSLWGKTNYSKLTLNKLNMLSLWRPTLDNCAAIS